jgi:hypothetical protein
MRWNRHFSDSLPGGLDISIFLLQSPWSNSTVKVVTALLYRSDSARIAFYAWLKTNEAAWTHIRLVENQLIDLPSIALFRKLLQFFFDDHTDSCDIFVASVSH